MCDTTIMMQLAKPSMWKTTGEMTQFIQQIIIREKRFLNAVRGSCLYSDFKNVVERERERNI